MIESNLKSACVKKHHTARDEREGVNCTHLPEILKQRQHLYLNLGLLMKCPLVLDDFHRQICLAHCVIYTDNLRHR